jgi:hypothetical protein
LGSAVRRYGSAIRIKHNPSARAKVGFFIANSPGLHVEL